MRVRRCEIVDEYVEDGRAAIYTTRGMVVLLSELATSAWTLVGESWLPSEAVVDRLVEVYGDPADGTAAQLTEETLTSLADMTLVEIEVLDSGP